MSGSKSPDSSAGGGGDAFFFLAGFEAADEAVVAGALDVGDRFLGGTRFALGEGLEALADGASSLPSGEEVAADEGGCCRLAAMVDASKC